MPSKTKEAQVEQKNYLEARLNERLSDLAGKGMEPGRIAKDSAVRKLRADLRATKNRLSVIKGKEEKIEEMARLKAEKLAAPKAEKTKKGKAGEEQPEMSKRQQKKKDKAKEKAKKKEEVQ